MKVGDYVRTKNGLIFKIVGGNEDNWDLDIEYSKLEYMEDTWLELYKYNDNGGWFISEHCKSSPNIIDLIEVGDYVNGHKVIDVAKSQIRVLYYDDINQKYALIPMINKDIKSIVTREQFESMEYKICIK